MPVEVVRVLPQAVTAFYRTNQREALRALYNFPVVWHEQTHDVAALDGDAVIGAVAISVAASVATVARIVVAAPHRRLGIGRRLLDAVADVGSYYNCHKMSALVPHGGDAQRFFQACGYHEEAVLAQHTFKLDVAVLRKFLL